MAFLDRLKDHAMGLSRVGVARSKQLAEITKLSLDNVSEGNATKKAYVKIGKLYCAERGMAPEAAYMALCERITVVKINIEKNENRIAELEAEDNVSDADVPHTETGVPPEEPVDGGCSCCDYRVTLEKVFSDNDKPQEQASDPTGPVIQRALFL